jgi:hypothetical protein
VGSNDRIIDLKIVEQLCKFFSDLIGCKLPGKAVLLRIDEVDHPELLNTVIKGTIYDVKSGFTTTGPGGSQWSNDLFAIIHLDHSLTINEKSIEWLMTIPRHTGYGLYRLYCTWIAVYIYVLERPSPPQELSWNDISAICSMKLIK